MKNNEKRSLPFLTLILCGISLLFLWGPFIHHTAVLLAFPAIILGFISIIINRKRDRLLSIGATALAFLTLFLIFIGQSFPDPLIEDTSGESNLLSYAKSTDNEFQWTEKDFDSLVSGAPLTGVGGQTYTSIATTFGKPSKIFDLSQDSIEIKHVLWEDFTVSPPKTISLTFYKQEEGTWLLENKTKSGFN